MHGADRWQEKVFVLKEQNRKATSGKKIRIIYEEKTKNDSELIYRYILVRRWNSKRYKKLI